MFLNNLVDQNPAFVQAAIQLHQEGRVPPDTYVIDLDMLAQNARLITSEAHRLGLTVLAMTKQLGRNPLALDTLRKNGVDSFVAVDSACARAIHGAGHPIGNVGHLVQIPRASARSVADMTPENWTVFDLNKASEAGSATLARGTGREQSLLARIFGKGDIQVESHAGGFDAKDTDSVADRLNDIEGGKFGGISSYPALVFDRDLRIVRPAPNLRTLQETRQQLERAGRSGIVVNGPGETSTQVLGLLADAGVTQVEPGHGFTATGAYHAFAELPEKPAMLYLSEVSHVTANSAFVFGGGLYLCVGSVDYQPQAIVGRDLEHALQQRVDADISPNHQVIDFYGRLAQTDSASIQPGDTALFCFRAQAFYVRSTVTAISGVQAGTPRVEGVFTTDGRPF